MPSRPPLLSRWGLHTRYRLLSMSVAAGSHFHMNVHSSSLSHLAGFVIWYVCRVHVHFLAMQLTPRFFVSGRNYVYSLDNSTVCLPSQSPCYSYKHELLYSGIWNHVPDCRGNLAFCAQTISGPCCRTTWSVWREHTGIQSCRGEQAL